MCFDLCFIFDIKWKPNIFFINIVFQFTQKLGFGRTGHFDHRQMLRPCFRAAVEERLGAEGRAIAAPPSETRQDQQYHAHSGSSADRGQCVGQRFWNERGAGKAWWKQSVNVVFF